VAVVKQVGNYCYLKSGTGTNVTGTVPVDSAVLIQS